MERKSEKVWFNVKCVLYRVNQRSPESVFCVEAWHMCLVCPVGLGKVFVGSFQQIFSKYPTLSLLTGLHPTYVRGSKILGWSSTLSIIWLWRAWLRIWGVFNPPVTYGVTLWSGVRLGLVSHYCGRGGPLTYYGSLSSPTQSLSSSALPNIHQLPILITKSNKTLIFTRNNQHQKVDNGTNNSNPFSIKTTERRSDHIQQIITNFYLGELLPMICNWFRDTTICEGRVGWWSGQVMG